MHQERENLDIIFRRQSPEDVLKKLRDMGITYNLKLSSVPYEMSSYEAYDHYGYMNLEGYSLDEIRLRFDNLKTEYMKSDDSVFCMLYKYAEKVLEYVDHKPICRIEQILNWNSISSRIGQDILVVSWMAYRDVSGHNFESDRHYTFDWPYCIGTQDRRLNSILEKGVAENHFHLGGSTQCFSLSWAALMNHPDRIHRMIKEEGRFRQNLVTGSMDPDGDIEQQWIDRLRYAALIRVLLFERCAGMMHSGDVYKEFTGYDTWKEVRLSWIKDEVEALRFSYGEKAVQPHKDKCLDYAMSRLLYRPDMNNNNRLLAGERALLYHCFMRLYMGELTIYEKSIFYMYLLIKSNFRGELIQINRRNGFHNFSKYQDRKSQFFEELPEYAAEAQRLAVCSTIAENHIETLEARIMPGKSCEEMACKINGLDDRIGFASKEALKKVSYIAHFAKSPFLKEEFEKKGLLLYPRNYRVRKRVEKQAKAIYEFRNRCMEGQKRLCGIDACSNEIGCRPETFATEFRFLRSCTQTLDGKWYKDDTQEKRNLGITYHVGEDFLDICDGLRAVDEAVEFLGLRNGDRIGHGLVLGLEPEGYYCSRYNDIYLTKQDHLDNCIWLLYRTLEWDIPLDSSNRKYLENKAQQLMYEIYGTALEQMSNVSLEDYYDSWKLRADHPKLYESGHYQKNRHMAINPYNLYLEGEACETIRQNPRVAELYYLYHYDVRVKGAGIKADSISIKDWYVELMGRLQAHMRQRIAMKGISIECNPSSNYLIGYFNRYDQHPILKFNNYRLEGNSREAQIHVSINTDDLGVFDTSLNYEYALLYTAICQKRHAEGCYNDEAVFDYLNYIRESGLEMHFR